MPVIPVPSGDFHALFRAVYRLYQDPASWESTADFDKSVQGFAMISFFRDFGGPNVSLTQEELDAVANGRPDRIALNTSVRDWNYGLMTAGHVLVYTLRMAKHMPRLASAATSMRILEWLYSTPAYRWPASPTTIKGAWRKYRPIAPFVGAASFMPEEYAVLAQIFAAGLDASDEKANFLKADKSFAAKIVADKDRVAHALKQAERVMLPRYFALAEALRKAGENHYATGQEVHGNSLLDPETTWTLPQGFYLPAVTLDLPPLSDDEIKAAGVK